MDPEEDAVEIELGDVLAEILETQIQLIDAVTSGKALAEPEALKAHLEALRDAVAGAPIVGDDD
jgi:hypothetical protein